MIERTLMKKKNTEFFFNKESLKRDLHPQLNQVLIDSGRLPCDANDL